MRTMYTRDVIDYSDLDIKRMKPKPPFLEMVVVSITLLVAFAGISVFAEYGNISASAKYSGIALGILMVLLTILVIKVYHTGNRRRAEVLKTLALFAQNNDWDTQMLASRSMLPEGLPQAAYIALNEGLPWAHDAEILQINGSYKDNTFRLIYLIQIGPMTRYGRINTYQTYVFNKKGMSVFDGFVNTVEELKKIIETPTIG